MGRGDILEIACANPPNCGAWYVDFELALLADKNYSRYSALRADAIEAEVQNIPAPYVQ